MSAEAVGKPNRDGKGRFLSGNKFGNGGRPRNSVSITEALKAELGKVPPLVNGVPNAKTHLQLIIEVWLRKAEGGDAGLVPATYPSYLLIGLAEAEKAEFVKMVVVARTQEGLRDGDSNPS